MKRILCILSALCLLASQECVASSPKVIFGVEWGYSISFFNYRHFNYLDGEGSRVNEQGVIWHAHSNGNVLASVGLAFSSKCALSLCTGYMGIEDNNRIIPALIRFTFVPRGMEESGFVLTFDGGAGMNVLYNDKFPLTCGIGTGYRINISGRYSLDLKFNVRASYDQPNIYDPTIYGFVPKQNISLDQAFYGSAGISAAINF
ncbi:MAG: hypothetical protein MJY53_02440 [Bacteroidales bacterium]|nr:hypothetical protein [Bacteroidales bacterium]